MLRLARQNEEYNRQILAQNAIFMRERFQREQMIINITKEREELRIAFARLQPRIAVMTNPLDVYGAQGFQQPQSYGRSAHHPYVHQQRGYK